jgi:hypothetical protein
MATLQPAGLLVNQYPPWLTEELLTAIAEFLDFKGLYRLSLTSKKVSTGVFQEFLTKSHPHAVACISRRIMQARISTPFRMNLTVRDPLHWLRYDDLDEEQDGSLVLFCSEISDDRKSLVVRTSYARSDGGFAMLEDFIEATITPSRDDPMRRGAVSIKRELTTTTTEYTDGFDTRLALEWCPLEYPGPG